MVLAERLGPTLVSQPRPRFLEHLGCVDIPRWLALLGLAGLAVRLVGATVEVCRWRRDRVYSPHDCTDNELRVLARELYADVTNIVFVTGQVDDLTISWQPVDARLAEHGVAGVDLVDDTLFLRRTTQRTWRHHLWSGWIWLRRGLWWRWLWLRVVLWWQRRGANL